MKYVLFLIFAVSGNSEQTMEKEWFALDTAEECAILEEKFRQELPSIVGYEIEIQCRQMFQSEITNQKGT